MKIEENASRRELLRTALRGIGLTLLGGGGLALALRDTGDGCPPRTLCDACALNAGCERKPREAQRDDDEEKRA